MVAEVVAVGGAVDAFQPGDMVVGDNNLPCGHCTMCHGGQYNECASLRSMGEDIDGFMCQYQVMPQSQAIRLPAGTPVDTAVLTEPVNCAMGALQKLDLRPGKSYAVLGCGPIGLMFVALLKASGAAHIVASDLSAERLAMAKELGADILCDRGSDPVAALPERDQRHRRGCGDRRGRLSAAAGAGLRAQGRRRDRLRAERAQPADHRPGGSGDAGRDASTARSSATSPSRRRRACWPPAWWTCAG